MFLDCQKVQLQLYSTQFIIHFRYVFEVKAFFFEYSISYIENLYFIVAFKYLKYYSAGFL
jgi:hypothetical protein